MKSHGGRAHLLLTLPLLFRECLAGGIDLNNIVKTISQTSDKVAEALKDPAVGDTIKQVSQGLDKVDIKKALNSDADAGKGLRKGIDALGETLSQAAQALDENGTTRAVAGSLHDLQGVITENAPKIAETMQKTDLGKVKTVLQKASADDVSDVIEVIHWYHWWGANWQWIVCILMIVVAVFIGSVRQMSIKTPPSDPLLRDVESDLSMNMWMRCESGSRLNTQCTSQEHEMLETSFHQL